MLLITHGGLTVNMAHVAYIHWRQEETDPNAPAYNKLDERPVRVLLVLSTGNSVVAGRDLSSTAARFLRESITAAWAQGATLLDVRDLLTQYRYEACHTTAAGEPPLFT